MPARAVVPAIDPDSLQPAANVTVVRFVPHDRLLPRASLVVTHAGLGTIMAALAHGVPLRCMPLGRDQFFNASRVEAIGAGRAIRADAGADAIAGAVRALIDDAAARAAARRFATVIAGYGGAATAVGHLEALSCTAWPRSGGPIREVRSRSMVRPKSDTTGVQSNGVAPLRRVPLQAARDARG